MIHMQRINKLMIAFLLLLPGVIFAQKAERKNVREGNKFYQSEKFTEAEIAYRKSLEVNPKSVEGTYNLGNALYKQGKYPEAAEQYQLSIGQEKDPDKLAQAFHNMGNISLQNKEYEKSVMAYRQSLRLNPTDDETRYNLALAQKLLSNQQNQNQDQDKDKEKEDKDKKDQDKDQNQDQEKQDQQQQEDDKKKDKTQEQPQQNEQMSKDNAQQMLDAFLQDEKDTQEKVKKAQAQQQQRRKTDKEW